jgi:hypothetical protein
MTQEIYYLSDYDWERGAGRVEELESGVLAERWSQK